MDERYRSFLFRLRQATAGRLASNVEPPFWIFTGGTERGSGPLVAPPPCATVEEWVDILEHPDDGRRYGDLPDPLRAPPSVEPDLRRVDRG
jgi:hypothetical protein